MAVSVSPRVSQVLCWFLVPCVYTFLPCLMSQPRVVDASGTPVPNSPMQLSSSNFGSLHGSGSDLDGTLPPET